MVSVSQDLSRYAGIVGWTRTARSATDYGRPIQSHLELWTDGMPGIPTSGIVGSPDSTCRIDGVCRKTYPASRELRVPKLCRLGHLREVARPIPPMGLGGCTTSPMEAGCRITRTLSR